MTIKPIGWKMTRAGLRKVGPRAAERVLINHALVDTQGHAHHWLDS